MAALVMRRKWQNNDHGYLIQAINAIGFLLQRNAVLTSQGNPMLTYPQIQQLASDQQMLVAIDSLRVAL